MVRSGRARQEQNFATHIGTIASTTRASVSGLSLSLFLFLFLSPLPPLFSFSVAHLLNCLLARSSLHSSSPFSLFLYLPLYIFPTFFFLSIRDTSCPPSPSHLSIDVTLCGSFPLFLVLSRSISLFLLIPGHPPHPPFPSAVDYSVRFLRILSSPLRWCLSLFFFHAASGATPLTRRQRSATTRTTTRL